MFDKGNNYVESSEFLLQQLLFISMTKALSIH